MEKKLFLLAGLLSPSSAPAVVSLARVCPLLLLRLIVVAKDGFGRMVWACFPKSYFMLRSICEFLLRYIPRLLPNLRPSFVCSVPAPYRSRTFAATGPAAASAVAKVPPLLVILFGVSWGTGESTCPAAG